MAVPWSVWVWFQLGECSETRRTPTETTSPHVARAHARAKTAAPSPDSPRKHRRSKVWWSTDSALGWRGSTCPMCVYNVASNCATHVAFGARFLDEKAELLRTPVRLSQFGLPGIPGLFYGHLTSCWSEDPQVCEVHRQKRPSEPKPQSLRAIDEAGRFLSIRYERSKTTRETRETNQYCMWRKPDVPLWHTQGLVDRWTRNLRHHLGAMFSPFETDLSRVRNEGWWNADDRLVVRPLGGLSLSLPCSLSLSLSLCV